MADVIAEEWRIVPDFENYEVSNYGQVRRIRRTYKRPLAPGRNKTTGRLFVFLCMQSKTKNYPIHILVCVAFHGPKPTPKHQVAHWDGNKDNNRSNNLRWATAKENTADSIRHGTFAIGGKPGSKNHMAKLTEAQVAKIKRMRYLRKMTLSSIASHYGVTIGCIWQACTGYKGRWGTPLNG